MVLYSHDVLGGSRRVCLSMLTIPERRVMAMAKHNMIYLRLKSFEKQVKKVKITSFMPKSWVLCPHKVYRRRSKRRTYIRKNAIFLYNIDSF